MEHNPNLIPIFLEADTKEDLMALMFASNAVNGKMFNYMAPVKDGKKWVVWFYADFQTYKTPKLENEGGVN